MKKTIAVLGALIMTLSLAVGCKGKPTAESSASPSSSKSISKSSEAVSSSASESGGETVTVGADDPVAVVYFGFGGERTAGIINKQGKFSVAPGKYAAITTFIDNKAFAVTIGYGDDRVYDVIDKNGKVLTSFSQSDLGTNADWLFSEMDNYREGIIPFGDTDDGFGFVNTDGKILLPAGQDEILPFSEGLAAIKEGTTWRFIDTNGDVVIDLGEYSGCASFSEGLAYFFTQNFAGYMDTQGKAVFGIKSGEIYNGFMDYRGNFTDGLIPADVSLYQNESSNDGFGIMDKTGKVVFFTSISDHPDEGIRAFGRGGGFVNGWFPVCTSSTLEFTGYGFIDEAGNLPIPIQTKWRPVGYRYATEYDYANLDGRIGFYEDLCAAKAFSTQEEKIGFIDKSGNVAIDFQYDSVGPFSYGLAAVAVDNRGLVWSYIDAQGKTVIDSEFVIDSKKLLMSYASDFHQ